MPKHLISQLAHVELLTPKPEESIWFFKEVLGLEESARTGQSVYLRGWGEFFHHSLKVTEAKQSGVGHVGWRADSAEALDEAVRFLEGTGLAEGWIDGDTGHGPAYRFRSPDGHMTEIFWEVEWYEAPPEMRSTLKNLPQKKLTRGIGARRIDHVNLFVSSVAPNREFFGQLGFRHHEGIFMENPEQELGAWMAVTNLSHDLAVMYDPTGAKGRINHVAYWLDSELELLRAAGVLRENGFTIECGPACHGVSQALFLYVLEPGGNRIEIFSGGYLNFTPDWGPIKWYTSERPDIWFGGELPQSVITYGTPPVDVTPNIKLR